MWGKRKLQTFENEVRRKEEELASLECWTARNVVIHTGHLVLYDIRTIQFLNLS